MICDTHAHFDAAQPLDGLLDRAAAAGVTRILAVGGSPALNAGAEKAAACRPGMVALAVGFDRDQTGLTDALARLEARAAAGGPTPAPRAIGEIGLDYHHAQHTARLQRALCEAQLERAAAWRLPVCVHTRDADADTLALLRTYAATPWGRAGRPGVVHCFTGSAAFAEELLALGFCLGFSGIVTFRNADRLRTVAAGIPADRLLVETDAPFLAPVPMRGQPNEPAFAVHVAACLARQRGVSVAELADLTTANAFRLFGPWGGEEPGG